MSKDGENWITVDPSGQFLRPNVPVLQRQGLTIYEKDMQNMLDDYEQRMKRLRRKQ